MDNPNLVRKLREKFLVKPVEENKGRRTRYNLIDMSLIDPSMGQAAEIAKIIDYTVIVHVYFNLKLLFLIYFYFRKEVFLSNAELWTEKQDLIHYTLNGIMDGWDYLLKQIL